MYVIIIYFLVSLSVTIIVESVIEKLKNITHNNLNKVHTRGSDILLDFMDDIE